MNLEVSREIDASPEAVWSVITDIHHCDRTLSGIESVEVLTAGEYAPGFRWKETRKMFGMKATEEMMVTEVDPPHRTVVVAENGGTEYTTVLRIDPRGDASTLTFSFSAVTEHASAVSRVMMALFGSIGRNASRKMIEQDLADIAAEAVRREAA